MVQAYIFSILAAVYIASATRVRKPQARRESLKYKLRLKRNCHG
jgi:hypothetical protein